LIFSQFIGLRSPLTLNFLECKISNWENNVFKLQQFCFTSKVQTRKFCSQVKALCKTRHEFTCFKDTLVLEHGTAYYTRCKSTKITKVVDVICEHIVNEEHWIQEAQVAEEHWTGIKAHRIQKSSACVLINARYLNTNALLKPAETRCCLNGRARSRWKTTPRECLLCACAQK
jgi:hypothetical protein